MSLPLVAGELTPISALVWRVLAPNPSLMTGPGTNSYLLAYKDGLMVLDPGPNHPQHIEAILQASQQLERPITHILVTHTHQDHSPGAQGLLQHFPNAQLMGTTAPNDGLQDEAWLPDVVLEDGMRMDLGHGHTLAVISSPGHVDNHLCFLLEEEGILFTGDHLIDGSTVVIAPPSGSMSAYLHSLTKLQDYQIAFIAPGHGNLIQQPQTYIQRTIEHRLKREDKVKSVLTADLGQSLEEIVKQAYDDTPAMLHALAQYSLWAHLIKLQEDAVAYEDDNKKWWLCSQ